MQLRDVRAVVTGGVSGLGLAVARHVVAHGGHVALFDINADKGAAAVAELGDTHAHFFATDVTSETDVAANVQAARDAMDGITLCVNCAGILGAGRVLGKTGPMALQQFQSTVLVNLVGSFNVAKACADVMQHNPPGPDGERGVIVNTASIAGYEGQIGQAAYSASKAGIIGMTLPMARELARFGIRVNTIAPGIFLTPMAEGMPEDVQAALAASIPFPSRLGDPAQFADLVGYIAQNTYLNGETIRLDGATRLAAK